MPSETSDQPTTSDEAPSIDASVSQQLREAAYQAWTSRREGWQDSSTTLFDRAYLGHYSHIDHYVETMVDDYGLDAKLDETVPEPFRQFIDVDVTGLARSLVRHGSLYCIPAFPVGVWIFNGDME